MRNASTHARKGLVAILEKHPDDVVITFAKRTAMGRHRKGQFKDVPVDEMMQALFKVRLAAVGPNMQTIYCQHSILGRSPAHGARPQKDRGYLRW
jgi:acetyl-CoA acyltransferase 1